MTRHFNASQYKSKLRQIEQKQKRAISDMNRAINNYNRDVKKAINNYNSAVRKHNSNVRHNRQIINNELRKLNSTTAGSSYTVSLQIMQKHYETIGVSYPEGTPVTPEQNRILDLIENEQAYGLLTKSYIEDDIPPEDSPEENEIGNMLAQVSDDLNRRWQGALFSLNPNNPDATRHFCTSTRELLTEFLEIKAPDESVFEYNPNCQRTPQGNATRREKIKYMMRNTNMNESVISFVEEDINNILELNHLLSGGTHGPAGKYSFEKLLLVKKRVEQGLVFLCELAR